MTGLLPNQTTMYNALLSKDSSFEGIFYAGIKTTGIFCRPTCNAKKPKPENVEYFSSTKDAIINGYRPCKLCHPLEAKGKAPEWLSFLLNEIEQNPVKKIKDLELVKRGISPSRVRRWFKKNLNITFQAYLRAVRIGEAFERIKNGDKVIEAAFSSDYDSLSGFNATYKKTLGSAPLNSKRKNIIKVTRILTPLGPMLAGATDKGICLLEFTDRRMLDTQLKRLKKIFSAEIIPGRSKHIDQLEKELKEYFEGKRKEFSIPLVLDGTEFQVKAWKALKKINYGETASYKKQAETLGIASAVRAVAKANGDNRIAILIPCHRVIGSNGTLVGYGGGLWRKKHLLELEKNR